MRQVSLAVTLKTCIRKVLGSSFERVTGHPYLGFSCFYSVPLKKWEDSISTTLSPRPFKSLFNSLYISHPTIRRYVVYLTRRIQTWEAHPDKGASSSTWLTARLRNFSRSSISHPYRTSVWYFTQCQDGQDDGFALKGFPGPCWLSVLLSRNEMKLV
jgi:hypothetical protein